MLAVTVVNGCRYCSHFHTRQALRSGFEPEGVNRLLAEMLLTAWFDLIEMLQKLIEKAVQVKAYGTCMVRFHVPKNMPLIEGVPEAKMPELAEWITDSDKVISF